RLVFTGQPFSNVFLQDGIGTTNSYYQERSALAPQLSLDTVHEFQVLSADYAADYGGAMGGVINAATRGGSENYHGTAYEYFSPGVWTAANRYGLGQAMSQRQNQFGATVGGPILPGKIFFLANGEVWDGRGTGINRITTPALSDPFGLSIPASNCKATAAQCAAAIQFLRSQMNVPVTLSGRSATGLAKVDYRRSDRNQFTVEGNAMNARSPFGSPIDAVAANGGLLGLVDSTEQIRYGKAGWVSAPTPNSVNELRFGLFQDRLSDPAWQSSLPTGSVAISVAGANVGNPHPNADSLSEHREELVDNLTLTSNTHTLRVGADLTETHDTINEMNAAGTYVYNSLTNFAQDFSTGGKNYTAFAQEFGTSLRKLPSRQYNLYAMDTWRPVDSVTIIAGVRWEKPRRAQPSQVSTTYYLTSAIAAPLNDFAPRISAAFQADPRTVVRLGYAWFFAPMPGELQDALFLGNGLYQTGITVNPNQTGALAFPNVFSSVSSIPSGTTNIMYGDPKLRDPHTQQFNLAIERSLGRGTTLTVTGIRNRGFKLWSLNDLNLVAPTVTKTYAIDDANGVQTGTYSTLIWNTKNDPKSAHVYEVQNAGSSWYNAASVELRKRMSHGLSFQASYTWSHNIDNTGGPAVAGFLPLNTNNGDITSDKANSPVDQRNRAVINWIWQPAVTRIGSPALRYLVNGWSLSSITSLASGHPVTPLVLVGGQQFSTVTMAYTNSLNGSGGWPRVPFEGIGSLATGPQYNVDARLSRTLRFTERVQGVVMFEAFNAFNTQFTTSVNTIAYMATPTAPPVGAVSGPTTGVLHPVTGVGTGNAASEARRCQVAFRVVF
ncbi:MAG TPA: TonB-dependent receptor, partial [Bryobacteraceae bacterium]